MALTLKTIRDQVKDLLPFLLLLTDPDPVIDSFIAQAMIEVSPYSGKVDPLWLEESDYTELQKLFFARYVAYLLIFKRVLETATGDGDPDGDNPTGTGNTVLSKAEVDVLAVEFDLIKSSDKDLGINTEKLLDYFRILACSTSRQLGWSLGICGPVAAKPGNLRFIEFTDC